jgi:predicted deacetylase
MTDMKKYTAIVEHNSSSEGETWVTFIPLENNENSLSKLKEFCDRFEEHMEDEGDTLKILSKEYTEEQVDFLVESGEAFGLAGYDDQFKKVDCVLELNGLDKIEEPEDFVDFFYKGKWRK